jgi:hypothetical protein
MSEEDFLSRWSRRKRDVAAAEKSADGSTAKVAKETSAGAETAPKNADEKPKKEVDLSLLPPIESITSATDVTAFLQAGVPLDLTRAALRRAWTADPAIRDFVGLAEYAWDFTDPTAMPGFGPLEMTDDVRKMISQVVDQIGQTVQSAEQAGRPEHLQTAENSNDSSMIIPSEVDNPGSQPSAMTDEAQIGTASKLGNEVIVQSSKVYIATQHSSAEAKEKPQQFSRRSHGGALPQ